MKKAFLLLLAAVLLLSCAACGEKAEAPSGGVPGSFDSRDICLVIGGTSVTADTTAEELLALLGEDYDYAEAISCVYDGMDKTYTYPDFVLYTYPQEDGDKLMELYCSGGEVQTSRGIALGATREEVIAQYGEPTSAVGLTMSYELETTGDLLPASLYFMIRDGKVAAIAITAEHRAE